MSPAKLCDCGHVSGSPQKCDECNKTFCESCWKTHVVEIKTDRAGNAVIVELHDAYVWDCDECGRENVVRPTSTPLDASNMPAEQRESIMEQFGIETPEEFAEFAAKYIVGRTTRVPAYVTCKHCSTVYAAAPQDVAQLGAAAIEDEESEEAEIETDDE